MVKLAGALTSLAPSLGRGYLQAQDGDVKLLQQALKSNSPK